MPNGAKRTEGIGLKWEGDFSLSWSFRDTVLTNLGECYRSQRRYYGSSASFDALGTGVGAGVGGTALHGAPVGEVEPWGGQPGYVGVYVPITLVAGAEELPATVYGFVENISLTWADYLKYVYFAELGHEGQSGFWTYIDGVITQLEGLWDDNWRGTFPTYYPYPFRDNFIGTPTNPWGAYYGGSVVTHTQIHLPVLDYVDCSSGSLDAAWQIFFSDFDMYNYVTPNAGYDKREFNNSIDLGDYSYVTAIINASGEIVYDETTYTGLWEPYYLDTWWKPTAEGEVTLALGADTSCSADVAGLEFNGIATPFPTESGTYNSTTYTQSAGAMGIGTGGISRDLYYPTKLNFALNSFYVDYDNATTDMEYEIPALGKWNSSTEEYEAAVITADTAITIGANYSLSGDNPPDYILSSEDWHGSALGYCYLLPEISSAWILSDDGFLTVAPIDAAAKIRVLPLTSELNATSPWWTDGVFTYTSCTAINVFPSTCEATNGSVASSAGVTTLTTNSGATSPALEGLYASQYSNRLAGLRHTERDPMWGLTGPNGTLDTDLEEWGVIDEDNYQFSEHRYLEFDIVAPKIGTVVMKINFSRSIYIASLDYNIDYPYTATYSFDTVSGVNSILIDLLCNEEDWMPVGLHKMNYVSSIEFIFPNASGVEQWAIDETSFNLIPGGAYPHVPNVRFVDNDRLLSFCATHDGKDAVELALQDVRWGDPVPANPRLNENKIIEAYDTGRTPMVPESPLVLADILNMQAGWSATYTSPLDTTYNKDINDDYMCITFACRDLRHEFVENGGVVMFSPLVDIFNLVPGFEYTVYIEGVMRGGIQGIVRNGAGTDVERSAPVYLYMLEYDPATPSTTYSYLATVNTDNHGYFYFGGLKRSGGSEQTDGKRRYYGVSATYNELTAEPADLGFFNLTVKDRQITNCNVETFDNSVVTSLTRIVSVDNRFGISHVFYIDGNKLYRSSSVRGKAEFENAQVLELPSFNGSLWACYYGNSLMVGGNLATNSDFIIKSDDEGLTWQDVPLLTTNTFPPEPA